MNGGGREQLGLDLAVLGPALGEAGRRAAQLLQPHLLCSELAPDTTHSGGLSNRHMSPILAANPRSRWQVVL